MSNFASQFRELVSTMSAKIQDTFGECIVITPVTIKPNFPPEPDASRPAFDCRAVFTHKPAYAFDDRKSERASGHKNVEMAPLVSTSQPRFTVRACELPHPIGRGFRIRRLFDDSEWEVTESKPDSIGSMIEVSAVQFGKRSQLERPKMAVS